MKKKIIVYSRVTPEMTSAFEDRYDFIFLNENSKYFIDELKKSLPDASGLIGANLSLDGNILDRAAALKAISTVSVGYDKYDLDYLNSRGIYLTNTPDVLTETTADLALSLMLCCARRVSELDTWTKNGNWNEIIDEDKFGSDVHGKKVGIIGMGRIGSAVARRAHLGFGMEVLYFSRNRVDSVENELNAKYVKISELLAESDFVIPVLPLTNDTRHLMNSSAFDLMKKDSILVNVSRGPIVDEDALIEAIKSKKIRGAGLDVYSKEPLNSSPLFQYENIITLPHIGSATKDTRDSMARYALASLVSVLDGDIPVNVVNDPR